jgi:hypothetical protein
LKGLALGYLEQNVKASWTLLKEGQGYRHRHLQPVAFLGTLGSGAVWGHSGVRAAGGPEGEGDSLNHFSSGATVKARRIASATSPQLVGSCREGPLPHPPGLAAGKSGPPTRSPRPVRLTSAPDKSPAAAACGANHLRRWEPSIPSEGICSPHSSNPRNAEHGRALGRS